jgi:predicted nucleic acid-binding protein
MRLFVDANIIVSVLNKEYPLFSDTARILSLADRQGFDVFTSPVCLAIAFYFAEKKYKRTRAKVQIDQLCRHIRIAPVTVTAVSAALANTKILDFEDGMEYYAAIESGCSCIITEDTSDFYFSDIAVLNSRDFLQSLLTQVRRF